MDWTWHFNPATLLGIVTALVGLVTGWVTMRSAANDAKADARRAHERIDMLNGAISAYRETQASTVVSRDALKEMRDDLFERIDKLTDRVDKVLTGGGRRPP